MLRVARRFALALAVATIPAIAGAYGVRIHRLLPGRTLAAMHGPWGGSVGQDTLPALTDADLDTFRRTLWDRAAHLADTALRRTFLARYPAVTAFDPRAFKEFLMMNGSARVLGIDSFAAVYRAMTPHDRQQDPSPDYRPGQPIPLRAALEMGSSYPDLDRRNQNRLLRGPDGKPRLTAAGDSVPFDPMTLNMGRLTGVSSQAHAHLGLNRHAKSSDPDVLKQAPWDFAIAIGFPGPVETYAPDNAQMYSDLAVLAALDGRPSWRALSTMFAGNVMHYVADVGNAVHTVQVGIYPIFVDATIQAWMRRAGHLFGLFGPSASRNTIGIDIVANLHTLSERLYETELTGALRARDAGNLDSVSLTLRLSLTALERGDDSLTAAIGDTLRQLTARVPTPDFGRAITCEVIDANFRDGAEVYRATREIVTRKLRVGAVALDFDTVPDESLWRFLRVRDLDDFNRVHARGLARTTSALRAWWDGYLAASATPAARRARASEAILTRLVSERLRYLDAAESRRRTWLQSHGGSPR